MLFRSLRDNTVLVHGIIVSNTLFFIKRMCYTFVMFKNRQPQKSLIGFFFAAFSIFVWGITFVCTKSLLQDFSALEILVIRFLFAYVMLWILCPHPLRLACKKDGRRGRRRDWRRTLRMRPTRTGYGDRGERTMTVGKKVVCTSCEAITAGRDYRGSSKRPFGK